MSDRHPSDKLKPYVTKFRMDSALKDQIEMVKRYLREVGIKQVANTLAIEACIEFYVESHALDQPGTFEKIKEARAAGHSAERTARRLGDAAEVLA